MSKWQERITRETAPSIRVEHELRYRLAAPLILAGEPWADLGCGNGLAAAAALGDQRPGSATLADMDAEAVARAAEELGMPQASRVVCDLTDPAALRQLEATVLELGGSPTITCFEVVEHLHTFLPLIEWAVALVHDQRATFVMSVPNDAFWAIQNPHHATSWSEGAFRELLTLLPEERTLLRQVAVTGSAVMDWDAHPVEHPVTVTLGDEGSVASHFIAAFGADHERLWRGALAVQTDQLEQRRWERQRESDAAVAQQVADEQRAAVAAQDVTIARQREELQAQTRQFDDWRAYIHELERELGRPPSGGEAQAGAAPDTGEPTA